MVASPELLAGAEAVVGVAAAKRVAMPMFSLRAERKALLDIGTTSATASRKKNGRVSRWLKV